MHHLALDIANRLQRTLRDGAVIPACMMACACGAATLGESHQGDIAVHPSVAKASDAPLPETAFTDDTPPPVTPVPGDAHSERFAARHIGSDDGIAATPRFRGARVDFDLKGIDLHDVFRLLADVGKVNIVVAGDVSGTVTMRLRQVPWDQAMATIASARGLVYEREGNVILVRRASRTR